MTNSAYELMRRQMEAAGIAPEFYMNHYPIYSDRQVAEYENRQITGSPDPPTPATDIGGNTP